jgi:ECF transporter S component (folate family)
MNNKTRTIIHVSLLIALEVVLSRFCSIATPVMKIGFGFVPVAVCGMMYGPAWAAIAGALADITGASLFPVGPFFPGFTVSAALTGAVFGLFLRKQQGNWLQLAGAVGVNCLGVSLLLSTFWLTIITSSSFWALLPTRVIQNIIMIPVQFIVLRIIKKPVSLYAEKFAAASHT